MYASTLVLKAGAQCGSPARWDLCGGPLERVVPTAIIESVFSKMSRTFLRHIRVDSTEELKERILKGVEEFNAAPVVFRWNKFDLGVA